MSDQNVPTTVEIVQKWVDVHHPEAGPVVDVSIEEGECYGTLTGCEAPRVFVECRGNTLLEIPAHEFDSWLREVFAANMAT